MRAIILVTLLLAAGCASSLERIQEVREAAPEWYKERRVELAGEDYPSIADMPTITAETRPGQTLPEAEAATLAALRALLTDPRNRPVDETGEEMRAWSAAVRADLDRQIPPADFLTDEEVAALKAIFDTARARL